MTLDISQHQDPEAAARALHEYLADTFDADEAKLYSPEETARIRDCDGAWMVAWEGGPFEWATNLTAGWSIMKSEMPSIAGEPEVEGFYEDTGWVAEPYYKFDLLFYPQ